MRVLGIMSGTSIDNVDYAVCSFNAAGKIKFEEHWQTPFPKKLKERIQRAASNEAATYEVAQLHHDLGRFYAEGAKQARKVQLAGLHGQTVFHNPRQPAPATLQIGEPTYLARALRAPVISNFRSADLAAGGQGAPLATMFHVHVFAQRGKHIAVNNLGGISNVTSIDWRKGAKPQVLAFDTGPANMLMDLAVKRFTNGKKQYDRGGEYAKNGATCWELVSKWLKHPFFKKSPPKSTGREEFGEVFLNKALKEAEEFKLSHREIIATFTSFTAWSIALNYSLHLTSEIDEVILCGGGARNPFFSTQLRDLLVKGGNASALTTTADHRWDPQVIEASAFALLAWLRLHDQPGNIPQTTGAAKPTLLGQITLP